MKRFYLVFLILIIAILIPISQWYLEPTKSLKLAIIDKTVPDESYKEHLGLVFLLNQLKYLNEGDEYSQSKDYYGFLPGDDLSSYDIKQLPSDYSAYDGIYIGDTYGVYNQDQIPSEIIYGGLADQEWSNIINWINNKEKSLLIAEYNTFSSPTKPMVRESITNYLGVSWSGWTGRYFKELDPEINKEIPQGIVDRFGDSWDYRGGGFILVNDIDNRIVVLEDDKDILNGGIKLEYTRQGKDFFGLNESPEYFYWFDIITPIGSTEVLANYQWSLTENGKKLIEDYDIPSNFAAVVRNKHGSSLSYYFAGDYNYLSKAPSFNKVRGLDKIYSLIGKYSEDSFYWSAYFPMMEAILDDYRSLSFIDKSNGNMNIQYNARVKDGAFEILEDGQWKDITIKGVNIGMAKPGTFPGEAAITEEEYYRWFEYIGQMNSNTIRVYTLHPPGFYNALARYNESHEEKIYVMHGVWINEEKLVESLDAFEEDNLKDFQDEMKKIVDVIHGKKIVEAEPGHAYGIYSSDISEYVISFILGIEWDPYLVENTNLQHGELGDYKGKYFETKDAKAFEYWLAQQMDLISQYEAEKYGWIRPVSFTNWVTTDILDHPSNLDLKEDMVSVDPNALFTKGEMDLTGQFASYHIYPYYPDFMNYDENYKNHIDHRGEYNTYAGYLKELNDSHRLPILVAEFGVPGSRGLTHENRLGWNQGFLSEGEQGEIISRLYEDILEEDMLGGLVFTWQDEWFKRTWNTMDYDNPDRRPFWSNAQTNEQQFGLLSFDRHKIQVDGSIEDWKGKALYSKDMGIMKDLFVDHDERYLYIRLDYKDTNHGYPLFLLDTVPNQGNYFIERKDGIEFSNGVDFLIDLNKDESRILIDNYYDFFTYLYAYELEMIEKPSTTPFKNSGSFQEIHYVLSRDYPSDNKDISIDFTTYETGKLKEGNGNPSAEHYDSLADYYIGEDGILELRIPWLLIQARDPSKKEFMGDLFKDGMEAASFVDEISIGALYLDEEGKILDSFPPIEDKHLTLMKGFSWDDWDIPLFEERLKKSYYILKDLFSRY